MVQRPPPSLVDFTRRLLQYEMERANDPGDLADGFRRVCHALHDRQAALIGTAGFDALFARAHILAARDHPILAATAVSPRGDCSVSPLPAVPAVDAQEGLDALATLLAHLIWLLVAFIGGTLGLGTVCELWPEVPFERPDADPEVEQ